MTVNDFMPQRIAQVELGCTDLTAAKDFYCGKLGLELVGEIGDSLFVRCGEVNLIIQLSETPRRARTLYFSADNEIESAVATFKAKGIQFTQEPRCIARGHEGFDVWLGFFNDPWGNQLALIANMPSEQRSE